MGEGSKVALNRMSKHSLFTFCFRCDSFLPGLQLTMECDWDELVDSIVYKLQHQLPRTASEVDTIRHLANVPKLW